MSSCERVRGMSLSCILRALPPDYTVFVLLSDSRASHMQALQCQGLGAHSRHWPCGARTLPPDCVGFNLPAVPRSYPRGRPCTDMDRPTSASRLPGSGVDRWGSFAKPLFPWLLESSESGHSEPGAIPPAHPSPDLLCCPDAILLFLPS